ncbi:MAG: NAD-dependent epimerase/dehydratase family protein [Candidatus Kapaibacteriales bacterium]
MGIRKILVTGACGQIGSELTPILQRKYGFENVITSDVKFPSDGGTPATSSNFEILDVTNFEQFEFLIQKHSIDTIIHLAAVLSAVGENHPEKCWNINIQGTLNAFNLGVKHNLHRVFVPSSIAVWGDGVPKVAPQDSMLKPKTIYGITKVTIELLADYYYRKFGLDCRGVRFPGIISSETPPGGGTTDYAVEIFYHALTEKRYVSFVDENTRLPMMYMPDCIKAIVGLLEAPNESLTRRCDYNVGSMDFDMKTLVNEIKKHIPDFQIEYKPDFRQEIANSWPNSVDDSIARKDWGWNPDYNLQLMVSDMINKLSKKLKKEKPSIKSK